MSASATTVPAPEPEHAERPWGSWEVLAVDEGCRVRRVTIAPYSRLSLQVHAHRAEHWLVVVGVAACSVGAQRFWAEAGTHVFVPRGTTHRLANDESQPLILIEVQVGDFTGEEDGVPQAG